MFNSIIGLLSDQIFGQTFILIGIIVFIGYMALKESFGRALTGALKASIGVLAMSMGSGALISNFNNILNAIVSATGIRGAGLNTYPAMLAVFEIIDPHVGAGYTLTCCTYGMLVCFAVHLLLVAGRKWTHCYGVFLDSITMIGVSATGCLIFWRFAHLPVMTSAILGGVVTAIYFSVGSTILRVPTKEITGADMTIGHVQMFPDYAAWKLAPYLGDPEDSIETKELPSFLSIFQDSQFSTFLIMFLSVVIVFFIIGNDQIDLLRNAYGQGSLTNNLILALWISLTLTANIYVLLAGVRLMLGEIQVSFQGISDKLLPGAIPAVDCAAIFAFAPKSVILGFMCGVIGQVIGLLLLIVFHAPVMLIPGFIPLFFDNATVGIFANKYGGWKAAVIICICHGIIQILGAEVCVALTGATWWQGSGDFSTVWMVFLVIVKFICGLLGIPVQA